MGSVVLLILFAFVAGAATALSPCVLPVLPVALSAGATGGRGRPLGVVTGLVLSFTFATVALVYVISALGLPDDLLRNLAIAVLAGFGLVLIVPGAAARVEAAVGGLTRRASPRTRGEGFGSGMLLGSSLGIVYAPCAGPILAGVITVSASQDFTAGRLAVALSYALGTAVVLYALMLGGRRLIAPLSRRSSLFQPAIGAVMVTVAVAMAAELDIRFQNEIADNLPAVIVNPSGDLEEAAAVHDELADLRGGTETALARAAERAEAAEPVAAGSSLPVLAPAPEIRGTQEWFNTPGRRPLSLTGLRGEVVLIDFWTYSCINCIRTLPYLKAWDERYRDAGLNVIGVHAPEFPFERDAGNVEAAVERNGLRYAVAQDNEFATWSAYGNQFWPAKYLIDARGRVRYYHFGEGDYEETEQAIRSLLAEAGEQRLGGRTRARVAQALPGATPESYLGAARAERFVNGRLELGTADFRLPEPGPRILPLHHLGLDGRWRVEPSRAVAAGPDSRVHLRFAAKRVFLVLGASGGPKQVEVQVDGRRRRTVQVTGHRLYEVARLPRPGVHLLTLHAQAGTEAFAFTFG
jgi:cytochrome c biogenesis protein CcdA/thiol-disulfide isomerase/thioredoxin